MEADDATSTTSEAIATRLFAAPESFRGDENEPLSHGSKTDVFSLGLVFVELLVVLGNGKIAAFRDEIFKDYTHCTRQYHRVAHKFQEILEVGWRKNSDYESRSFYESYCEAMLQKRRKDRPSARCLFAKIKQHRRALGLMRCDCQVENEPESWTERKNYGVDDEDDTEMKDEITGNEGVGTRDTAARNEGDNDSDWVYLEFQDLF
jgi:serine/threonine protein kinase